MYSPFEPARLIKPANLRCTCSDCSLWGSSGGAMGVPDSPRGVVPNVFPGTVSSLWQVSFFVLMLAFVFAFVGQCRVPNSSHGIRPPPCKKARLAGAGGTEPLRDYCNGSVQPVVSSENKVRQSLFISVSAMVRHGIMAQLWILSCILRNWCRQPAQGQGLHHRWRTAGRQH